MRGALGLRMAPYLAAVLAPLVFGLALVAYLRLLGLSAALDSLDQRLVGQGTKTMGKFEDLQAQEAATSASVAQIVSAFEGLLAGQKTTLAALSDAQGRLASLQAQVQAMGGVDPAKYDALTADLAALKSKVDAAVGSSAPEPSPSPTPAPASP